MSEWTPTPQFEEDIRQAFQVPEIRAAFVDQMHASLMLRAIEKTRKPRPFFMRRPVWVTAFVLVAAIIIGTIVIGPQKVLAAFRGLFGYVPGIGQVQLDGSLLVLAPGASLERQGITLSVERGAADSLHTVLVYRVEGLSIAAANSQGEAAATGGIAVLLFPDGSFLTVTGGDGTGWGTGYQNRLNFPALPKGVRDATLLISRLNDMPAGAAPEDWRIPLHFEPAPADLKVMPVYDLTVKTPTSLSVTTSPAVISPTEGAIALAAASNAAEVNGIRVSLDQVTETESGFILRGSISRDPKTMLEISLGADTQLLDAGEKVIPTEWYWGQEGWTSQDTSMHWGLVTNSKAYPGPWKLKIPSIIVRLSDLVPLEFDLGPTPQIGQTWDLNQSLDVAGHQLIVQKMELTRDQEQIWLNFTFGGPDIYEVTSTGDLASDNNNSRGSNAESGTIRMDFSYGQVPTGKHSIRFGASILKKGPWLLGWQPPATTVNLPTPTAQPQACLTEAIWNQIQNQPAAGLPIGLAGNLLVETNTGQPMPQISLVKLDGSQPKALAIGALSALSPDGETAAFITSNGPSIFLETIATGKTWPLPGSTQDDSHPLWSPDGQWIAYMRSNQGIFIQHLDGSNQKQVTDSKTLTFLSGWLPDGQSLVVTRPGAGGVQVQRLNLATGARSDLFWIENPTSEMVQLSPDGKQIAYLEKVFGKTNNGVWIAALDGSGKRLLASLDSASAAATAWSPDGRWLALTVSQAGLEKFTENIFLLQPDTCQVVPVKNIEGRLVSWKADKTK